MDQPYSRHIRHAAGLALLTAAALVTACDGQSLSCTGPSDCSGNPCCLTQALSRGTDTLTCTRAPDACGLSHDPDYFYRRLCHNDDDCIAGGISTNETKCCLASVMSHKAYTCTGPSQCGISSEAKSPEQR